MFFAPALIVDHPAQVNSASPLPTEAKPHCSYCSTPGACDKRFPVRSSVLPRWPLAGAGHRLRGRGGPWRWPPVSWCPWCSRGHQSVLSSAMPLVLGGPVGPCDRPRLTARRVVNAPDFDRADAIYAFHVVLRHKRLIRKRLCPRRHARRPPETLSFLPLLPVLQVARIPGRPYAIRQHRRFARPLS